MCPPAKRVWVVAPAQGVGVVDAADTCPARRQVRERDNRWGRSRQQRAFRSGEGLQVNWIVSGELSCRKCVPSRFAT